MGYSPNISIKDFLNFKNKSLNFCIPQLYNSKTFGLYYL